MLHVGEEYSIQFFSFFFGVFLILGYMRWQKAHTVSIVEAAVGKTEGGNNNGKK